MSSQSRYGLVVTTSLACSKGVTSLLVNGSFNGAILQTFSLSEQKRNRLGRSIKCDAVWEKLPSLYCYKCRKIKERYATKSFYVTLCVYTMNVSFNELFCVWYSLQRPCLSLYSSPVPYGFRTIQQGQIQFSDPHSNSFSIGFSFLKK
jgi:hypothetical protein